LFAIANGSSRRIPVSPSQIKRGRRPGYIRVVTGPRVVLYGKPGCHLCEDMHTLVRQALRGTGVRVAERNIALNLDDFVRYRHDIPVLAIDGREVARHRVTEEALFSALRGAGIL
jgi:hypothetical protein